MPPSARDGTATDLARRRQPLEFAGLVALALLAPAAVVYLSFNAGGYFPSPPAFVAIVLAQALVLRTTLAARPFEGFSRALAVPLVALALFAAWQLASASWSHATARALDSYDRTLLYVLALALFGSLRYTRARADWLVRSLTAGIVLVCLAGFVSRTLPHTWPTAASFFNDRLSYPLTYWNAEGMLAAFALILGFHLSADSRQPPAVRILAAAALPGVAATLLLTFSRGALGVAVLGLVAYCLLTRAHTLPLALLAVAPPIAIAVRSAWDATLLATSNAAGPQGLAQGRHVALVVALCMVGAGALRALLLPADRRLARLPLVARPPAPRVRARIGFGLAALAVALAVALGAVGLVRREYDKFVHGTAGPHVAQTRERLTNPANNGRVPLWNAALDIYRTQRLRGTGAGTYQQYYPQFRSEDAYVTDAHSLYLQSLAELGVVGGALIVLVVLALLGGLASRIRGPDRALYAALLAVALAWAVHGAIDWDWQMPAVTLVPFILAGLALARPASDGAGLRGLPAGRTLVALCWIVLAVAPLLVGVSYARLQSAGRALQRGDCATAKHDALSSLSLSAKRPQAYAIVGVCDLREGFAPAALSAMTKAVALEPGSWEEQFWLAVARAGDGRDPRAAARAALALNPREPLLRNTLARLRRADPRGWEAAAPTLARAALTSGRFSIMSL
jgi:hypothetical protein